MTNNRNRIFSLIVLIVFSFVIISSSFFIITHTNHECSGEDCSVCMELAECHKTLNTLGTAFIGILHLSVVMFVLSVIVRSFTKGQTDHTTLISLKLELLN